MQHEVLPVTSGYRLVVTYNLLWGSGAPAPTAASTSQDKLLHSVAGVLEGWDRGDDGLLALRLEHQYTQDGLTGRGFRALKGRDARISTALYKANEALSADRQMAFYIVFATRTESYYGTGGGYGYSRYGMHSTTIATGRRLTPQLRLRRDGLM